jgi:3-oxoadipate enol-lactonase
MKEAIHYIDQGQKDGTPLVLVHAFPLNHTMWTPQIEALSEKHRVIAYDVRGHGKSDVGDGQYTIELFVDDLMALLDRLNIEKTVLCGLSMGGYIALRAMELHPERFCALVLGDTRSEADSDEAKIKRSATLKLIKEKGVTLFAEGFVKQALAPETFDTKPAIVQTVKEMITSNSPLGIGGALLAFASRTDTTESLKRIQIPTLILVGDQDQITPPSAALSLKKKIQAAQMHVIPMAGHLSNVENPAEFNQRLLSFIKEIP